jgi:hypothetical protein
LGSSISRPFSNLQETSSVIRYSSCFASLIAYVVDVAFDPAVDPDLLLSPEHVVAALELHKALTTALTQPTLIDALTSVGGLANEALYANPPQHFTKENLKGIILDTSLRLQDLFHALAFAIVEHPRFLPPQQNLFRSPVNRFLALTAWNADHNVFYDVAPLHNVMAYLQWSMRMTVFHQFTRLTQERQDEDPIP